MLARMRQRLLSFEVTPRQFEITAFVALIALTLIVFSGAAVRLSGSGLGCPDWPRCYGHVYPPLQTHALIEFSNRVVSGFVGLVTVVVALLAWRRRPLRRDLLVLALALPLGVLAQAVLGGYTVENKLAPGFVMAHFALSMTILVAAVALYWRARQGAAEQPRSDDRAAVWAVRALVAVRRDRAVRRYCGHGRWAAFGRRRRAGDQAPAFRGRRHVELDRSRPWRDRLCVWARRGAGLGDARAAPRAGWSCGVRSRAYACSSHRREWSGSSNTRPIYPPSWSGFTWRPATVTWLCVLWSVAAAGRLEPRLASANAQIRRVNRGSEDLNIRGAR